MPRREAPEYRNVRVPPERFATNLRALVNYYADVDVFFLAFPQPSVNASKMVEWWKVLGQLSVELNRPLIRVELPDEAFFSRDPVHLTAEGHQALARIMESSLSAEPTGQPAAP
jgi:lysophospholipase L1-like esterase